MTDNLTPIQTCDSLPNLGGFLRLRLAYSQDILQQKNKSDNELHSLVFLRDVNFLADYTIIDRVAGETSIESFMADYGSDSKHSFKFTINTDSSPEEFSFWYERKIRNRRIVLETTNMNGFVRIVNPFFLTYKHVVSEQYSVMNKYELSFVRASVINNLKNLENNVIKTITVICPPFSDGFGDGFQN